MASVDASKAGTFSNGTFVRIVCYGSPDEANKATNIDFKHYARWLPEMMEACGHAGVITGECIPGDRVYYVRYIPTSGGIVKLALFHSVWLRPIERPHEEVRAEHAKLLGHPFVTTDPRVKKLADAAAGVLDKLDDAEIIMKGRFVGIRTALRAAYDHAEAAAAASK